MSKIVQYKSFLLGTVMKRVCCKGGCGKLVVNHFGLRKYQFLGYNPGLKLFLGAFKVLSLYIDTEM